MFSVVDLPKLGPLAEALLIMDIHNKPSATKINTWKNNKIDIFSRWFFIISIFRNNFEKRFWKKRIEIKKILSIYMKISGESVTHSYLKIVMCGTHDVGKAAKYWWIVLSHWIILISSVTSIIADNILIATELFQYFNGLKKWR